MQDFLHASHDDVLQAIERFEKMISAEKVEYFDVHQIENIYDFYYEKNLIEHAQQILTIGLSQHPDSPALMVKKAIFMAEHGNIDEAYKLLKELAPLDASNPDVYMTLGWIMLQKSNTLEAVSYFGKAVEIAFEDKEDILLEISYNLNQHELYLESIKFLEQLLELNRDNENALFEYAFSLDKILEYDKSIEAYQQLLETNPFSDNGWYNLAIIYNKTGKHEEACKAYEYTITINPQHEEAYFNMGNSLVQSGCFKEAIDAYSEHITIGDDLILTYQYMADCWEQLGNYDLAIRLYQLVIKLAPKQSDAWYGLGTTLMENEDFSGGLQAIDQAISINPLNADYWFAHARGLFELDKVEDAAHSLENGLNLDPHELAGWLELIKLKIVLIEHFDIKAYISSLHEQYEDTASIHYLSAVAHFRYLNNRNEALSALSKALSIDFGGIKDIENDYPEFIADKTVQQLINNYCNE